MRAIQLLDATVANQIAAGEVVERPASVVKEMVENALDAGATRIQVEMDQGGRWLRISDDGSGIPSDSIELAFQRFATSKIHHYEDLWALSTMGFRGEALPSIASVAKVEVISRTAAHPTGTKLVIHGGQTLEASPSGGPVGTTLTVSELFYNTPARLKFMSSEMTEMGYIQQLMQTFALSHPEISFRVLKKGKEVLHTTGKSDLMGVVRQIFGRDLAESLYTVQQENPGGKLLGALSYPDYVRRDRNYQFLFINRRWVKVPAVTKTIDDLYADLVPKRNYPVAILALEVPPETVDVNVHPTKKEVKFRNFSRIAQLLRDAIQQALQRYHVQRTHFGLTPPSSEPDTSSPPAGATSALAYTQADEDDDPPPFAISPVSEPTASYLPVDLRPVAPTQPYTPMLPTFSAPPPVDRKAAEKEALQAIVPIGQVCDYTYIVAHYGSGMALIDQHVAQERHLYEKFIAEQKVLSQPLLIAAMVDIDAIDQGLLAEQAEVFTQSGFEWEPFGPNAIALRAIPHCLRLEDAAATFRDLLNELREHGIAKPHLERFNLMCKTLACHAAIRAGDVLSLEQMQEIVKQWAATQSPYTCPHGRPILLKFEKDEINRRFLRTW
jgi:DNA mismatch repair protein MutL